MSSYGTSLSTSVSKESKNMDIKINIHDLDMSQLTTAVMELGTNINTYLMQVFKEAHEKGLKSGYALGYDEGVRTGKEEGLHIGKSQGIKIGRIEGKHQYIKLLRDDDMNYEEPISLSSYTDNEYDTEHTNTNILNKNLGRLTDTSYFK